MISFKAFLQEGKAGPTKAGDTRSSPISYDKALKLEQNNSDIFLNWGIAKLREKKYLEAIEKFAQNHKDKNILLIEAKYQNENYYFGFLNDKNIEISANEIEKRFIKA
jgi:Tfp pilus assembly protein PilF